MTPPTRTEQLSFSVFSPDKSPYAKHARRVKPDPVERLRTLDRLRAEAYAELEDGAALSDLSNEHLFALDDGTRDLDDLIEVMIEEAKARSDERFALGLPL